MEGELARIAAQQGGYVLRSQAIDCGYRDDHIAALVRDGAWRRLRRGAYVVAATWEALNERQRHVLLARAVVARLDGEVVLTGYTGLAVHDVPLWGVDLSKVHVRRESGHSGRSEAGVVHHLADMSDAEIVERDGLLVATPVRAAVDAVRRLNFETGVVLLDGVRRVCDVQLAEATDMVERQRDWPGSVVASQAIAFSDPRAATVGESRCRVLFARIGLPTPDLQRTIRDSSGALVAVTDFYFDDERTVGEFDGRIKYGRELYERGDTDETVDLGEVVWREKRREDAIRDGGDEVGRVVWSELDGHDGRVRARFLRAFARSAARRPTG